MTSNEFLNILTQNPSLPLQFEYQENRYVRSDFHLTEIKNVHYDTVDCGGLRNEWKEVVVQLWENSFFEINHQVDSTKALKIFEVVERVRPILKEVEIKFEYGNANFHTAIMAVENVEITDKILVKLTTENTTCKAKDRATTNEEKELACCGPSTKCCG